MFNWGWNKQDSLIDAQMSTQECKKDLARQKAELEVQRKDLIKYMRTQSHDLALQKAKQFVEVERRINALELVYTSLQSFVQKFQQIDKEKQAPADMLLKIQTLVLGLDFVRGEHIPKLKKDLQDKYGKSFFQQAQQSLDFPADLRQVLSTQRIPDEKVIQRMQQIAQEAGMAYFPPPQLYDSSIETAPYVNNPKYQNQNQSIVSVITAPQDPVFTQPAYQPPTFNYGMSQPQQPIQQVPVQPVQQVPVQPIQQVPIQSPQTYQPPPSQIPNQQQQPQYQPPPKFDAAPQVYNIPQTQIQQEPQININQNQQNYYVPTPPIPQQYQKKPEPEQQPISAYPQLDQQLQYNPPAQYIYPSAPDFTKTTAIINPQQLGLNQQFDFQQQGGQIGGAQQQQQQQPDNHLDTISEGDDELNKRLFKLTQK